MRAEATRRSFLKAAGRAVGAGLAAPYLLTSRALGKEGEALPASDRVAVGHIGVEWMGGIHLSYYHTVQEARSVAACDVDSRHLEAAAKKIEGYTGGPCKRFKDFRKLLDDPAIDAVVIAVPDHWHGVMSILAAQAGKDIYCEKPMSLTVREAQAMVRAIRRYGRVFQTGSQQRADGEFRHACELVRSGAIGKITKVTVSVGGPAGPCNLPGEPTPDYMDWEMWIGPAPWRPYSSKLHSRNWRPYRDYAGGGMTDWGAHHFDIAQWGLGMDGSGPVEILPPDDKARTPLTYQYASGITMIRDEAKGCLFEGTDGKVEVNRGYLRTWPEELRGQPVGAGGVHLHRAPEGSWKGNMRDWLHGIRTRQRTLCDVAIGCSSVTVCHLGNIASWLNRPIRWDPAKGDIVGDDEAARMLDRPKRAPWTI